MSTRCGDLDPAVTLKMLTIAEGKTSLVERNLNKNSGVLGLSRLSPDIRDIFTNLMKNKNKNETGFSRINLTSQVYLWRMKKYIGAYLAVVGKPDAIILTDTIGETVPLVRWAVCTDMECFGIKIDQKKNLEQKTWPVDIATDDSPVRILVIQTNEEIAIARQTWSILNQQKCLVQGAVA
jgi:acetate kinase